MIYGAGNRVVEGQSEPVSMCWVIDQDKLGFTTTHKLFWKIIEMAGSEVDKKIPRDESQHW